MGTDLRESLGRRALLRAPDRDLRLVLLSHLAADLLAPRARLRAHRGRLARGDAARCDRRVRLLGGWLSDLATRRMGARWGRRIAGVVGHPIAAVAVVAAVYTPDPYVAAICFTIAAGAGALGVACAWAAATEIGGEHAGVVSGAMNMFGNLGGTICPLVIGFTLERLGVWEPSLPLGLGRLWTRRGRLARGRCRAAPRAPLTENARTAATSSAGRSYGTRCPASAIATKSASGTSSASASRRRARSACPPRPR